MTEETTVAELPSAVIAKKTPTSILLLLFLVVRISPSACPNRRRDFRDDGDSLHGDSSCEFDGNTQARWRQQQDTMHEDEEVEASLIIAVSSTPSLTP
ncbi:uncharacterized protein DS421_4g118310 [Arachis hypogaea]|nr:uncharacterized protein DS421_4g118310 [Arachis hypogaea]